MDPQERIPAAREDAGEAAPSSLTTTRTQESALAQAASSPTAPLPRGATLGRYVVLEALGEGGMGVVYAAYDFGLDRKVSLKLVRSERNTPERQERLLREAQAMARLSHPNVLTVHDVGTYEDQVFIAMEFAAGGTLKQWLRASPRGWRQVVDAFLQAGRGLAAAHQAGLVHRDFKPDNVLLGEDGRVRVTDFGLAILAAETEAVAIAPARASPASGTAAYMAPEQRQGLPADARADQYAFCVALHEGLCGERPTLPEPSPALARAGVPRRLEKVLERGLAAEPDQRYPTLHALLAELEQCRRSRRRSRSLAGGLALAASLAGFGAAALVPTPAPDSSPLACVDSAPRRLLAPALVEPTACILPGAASERSRAALAPATAPELHGRPLPGTVAFQPVEPGPTPPSASPRDGFQATQVEPLEDATRDLLARLRREGSTAHPLDQLVARVLKRLEKLLGGGPLDDDAPPSRALAQAASSASAPSHDGITWQLTSAAQPVTLAPGQHLFNTVPPADQTASDHRTVDALERALALHVAAHRSTAEIAETRFALAQAIWDSKQNPDRALALAQQAQTDLDTAASAPELETEVSSWLKSKLELRRNARQ